MRCFFVLFLFLFQSISWAEFEKNSISLDQNLNPLLRKTYSLFQFTGQNGLIFKGVNSANMLYLPLLPQWQLNSIDLHLVMYRAFAENQATNLSLFSDKVPISSMQLKGGPKDLVTWDATLTKQVFFGNTVNLKITSSLPEAGYDCTKITDPGFWVYITPDSTITFNYTMADYIPDLRQFPYPFIKSQAIDKDRVTAVINAENNPQILESVFNVANALGKNQTWRGFDFNITTLDQLTNDQKTTSNIILIGTAKELKLNSIATQWPLAINQDGLFIHRDGSKLLDNEGLIILLKSPWNPQLAMLVLTGNSDLAVSNATQKLRDPQFIQTVTFQEYAFINQMQNYHFKLPDYNKVTFAALNYDDQFANGTGTNTLNYNLDLTTQKDIQSVNLNVKYNASPFLAKNSFLTLKVNDLPVGGVELYKKTKNTYSWKATVDKNFIKPGLNTFAFIFTLHLPYENCSAEETNAAWGMIQKNSSIDVNTNLVNAPLNLTNVYSLLSGDLVISLPDNQLNNLSIIQKLINMIINMKYVNQIEIVDNSKLAKFNYLNKNIILIVGTNWQNELPNLTKLTPVYYDGQKLQIRKTLLPNLSPSDELPIGITELITYPKHSKNSLLIISGATNEGLQLALNLLSNTPKLNFTNGNIVLTYPNKAFISLQSKIIPPKLKSLDQSIIVMGVVIGLIVLISIIIISYFLMRKKRDKQNGK